MRGYTAREMSPIFRRRRPVSDDDTETAARLRGDSQRKAENEARRQASDAEGRRQSTENETRRQASDAKARSQTAENELRRRDSDAAGRRQAEQNDARERPKDAP